MKKKLLAIFATIFTLSCFSQSLITDHAASFGGGFSYYRDIDLPDSTYPAGFSLGVNIYNLAIGVTMNNVRYGGKYLSADLKNSLSDLLEHTNTSLTPDKKYIFGGSIGWQFYLIGDTLSITPRVGFLNVRDVLSWSVSGTDYIYTDKQTYTTYGADLSYYFSDNFGVSVGLGSKQFYDLKIIFRL
ncbi:MAG: hypothetical protein SNH18_10345 [Rikenellaceae bacterium]